MKGDTIVFPQYPQQYPPQNPYPQQPAPVQQPYPQQPAPAPAQQPAQQLASGSLDKFWEQPSAGSKAWSFHNKPDGTTYVGIVERPISDADIRQQTDPQSGQPKYFKDGRPMFVMVVPLIVQPDAEFPEGKASWWVRGQSRDELARAMAEAGAPTGPPEAGATITVTKTGERPSGPGRNPSYVYAVRYQRPQGAAEATQAPAAPVEQPAPTQPVQQAAPVQPGPAPGQPVQQTAGDLSPDQQALLARLTGQQAAG